MTSYNPHRKSSIAASWNSIRLSSGSIQRIAISKKTGSTDSMSRINKDEATLLVSTLQKYIEKIGKERVLDESIDFGLISPYKSQVQYIRGLIKRNAFLQTFPPSDNRLTR